MKCFERPWSRREEPGYMLEATHGSAIEKHFLNGAVFAVFLATVEFVLQLLTEASQ